MKQIKFLIAVRSCAQPPGAAKAELVIQSQAIRPFSSRARKWSVLLVSQQHFGFSSTALDANRTLDQFHRLSSPLDMSPRNKSGARRDGAKGSLSLFSSLAAHTDSFKEMNSVGMRKDQKPAFPPKNINLRQLRSSTTAAAKSTPSKTSQKSSKTSQEVNHRPQKAQKRKHAAEDEHSHKRLRKDRSAVSVPAAPSQDPVTAWQTGKEKPSRDSAEKPSE